MGEESGTVLHPETSKNSRTLRLCSGNTSKGWCWLYRSGPGTGARCVLGPRTVALHSTWHAFNSWTGRKPYKKNLTTHGCDYKRGIQIGQVCGIIMIFLCFWKTNMLNKAAFIWSKYWKNSNSITLQFLITTLYFIIFWDVINFCDC